MNEDERVRRVAPSITMELRYTSHDDGTRDVVRQTCFLPAPPWTPEHDELTEHCVLEIVRQLLAERRQRGGAR
jgi:hypothetical protein